MIITIFDGPGCMKCRATKRHLMKHGVAYVTEPARMPDGSINPKIANLGHQTLPIVTITDTSGEVTAHWSDLNTDNIQAAVWLAKEAA